MSLFIPITKVDVPQRLVYGTLSEELPDKTGEILDYSTAKPAFQEWSNQFLAASNGKSMGNVRAMHGHVAAGKLTGIAYDDAHKRIEGVAKIVDDDEWNKVVEGVYTGFSIGGGYARRWPDPQNPELMRYTPTLTEVSLVDNPALPSATFDVIKQDGTVECLKFHSHEVPVNSLSAQAKTTPSAALRKLESELPSKAIALPNILDLLDGLALLEDTARQEDNAEILACILTLQEYLCDEYGISDDGEEGDAQEDDASSEHYAAELVQSAHHTTDSTRKYMRKTVAKLPTDVQRHIAKMTANVEELHKRIAQLEKQPVPAKGVLRAFSKADDQPTLQAQLETLSPEGRARELMKLALANPQGM